MEDAEQDNADPFGLSEEQADTDRLLRQLLGTVIADRYADFCRLSSGRLPLTVPVFGCSSGVSCECVVDAG